MKYFSVCYPCFVVFVSPSARRAWVEILQGAGFLQALFVALREEGVG